MYPYGLQAHNTDLFTRGQPLQKNSNKLKIIKG